MSIRERVERDKQLEAAESGAVPSDLLSGVTDPSDSSYAPSGVTFNSMEPMEKSELAAAAMVSAFWSQVLYSSCTLHVLHALKTAASRTAAAAAADVMAMMRPAGFRPLTVLL
jgi:hypothetical protein